MLAYNFNLLYIFSLIYLLPEKSKKLKNHQEITNACLETHQKNSPDHAKNAMRDSVMKKQPLNI